MVLNSPKTIHSATEYFQSYRLRQLLWTTLVGMVVIAVRNFWIENVQTGIILAVMALFVLGLIWMARKGLVAAAAGIFLWMLALGFSAVIWKDAGLRDTGVMAYPGLLVIAAMVGGRRNLYGLLGLMVVNIIALTMVADLGIYHNVVGPVNWGVAQDLVIILVVIALTVLVFSNDIRNLLNRLSEENQRVLASQAHIEHMSQHDALTGLPNRLLTKDRFDQALVHIKRYPAKIGLLYLDLDNFKSINDAKGHLVGDTLLLELSQRLRGVIRETDTICRHSGDEFIILLESIKNADRISDVAIKVLEEISKPIYIDGNEFVCTASLGITIAPNDGTDFETLLKKADIAMYKAKESGRNTFHFYDERMNTNIAEHLEILAHMRRAVAEKQFVLQYQPQFDLVSGRVIGMEALIRWKHPEKGMIPPMSFIPLAESSGLIVEIGEWVVFEACRQAKTWMDLGFGEISMAVNVSSVQCKRGNLDAIVLRALEQTKLPPHCLELELTESLLIDDSQILRDMLRRLRALGVRFSIDDFGTGYSNLGYLKKFEMEMLKVDQSFVRRLCEDSQDRAIVQAILQMAHSLGLHTIAEGIEDENTAHLLQEMGCEFGQGYWWSKPLFAEDMTRYLQGKLGIKNPEEPITN